MTVTRALTTAGLVYVDTTPDGAVAAVYVPAGNRALRRQLVLRQLAEGRERRRAGVLR
jgi:hypothetical protein